jgi:CRP-like cAMP-binding protein
VVPLFRQDTKVQALKRSPLFVGLSRKQLAQVAKLTDDLDVPPGTALCKEGSLGREFFVIIEGQADVTRGKKRVSTLGPGDFFGEVALLEQLRRTATVTARTGLKFFVVSERTFKSLLETDPEIERKILRALARRLASMTGDPTVS